MLGRMARPTRSQLLAQLQTLAQRQATLRAEVLRTGEFVVGTVSEVHARCGKPGCQCTRGQGHPQMRLLYAEGGRRRCKLVRQADWARLRQAGARYRQLRAALRALAALHARELRLLRALVRQGGLRYQ
jgi:hypothetical protein